MSICLGVSVDTLANEIFTWRVLLKQNLFLNLAAHERTRINISMLFVFLFVPSPYHRGLFALN